MIFFVFSKTVLKMAYLIPVFENSFLLSKTRKTCFVPSFFCSKKCREYKKNLNLENKTSFHITPKRCFLCFQKLFYIFKNKLRRTTKTWRTFSAFFVLQNTKNKENTKSG